MEHCVDTNADDGRPKENSMARIQALDATQADVKVQELPAAVEKEIQEVVARYIDGGRASDSSIMKPAFHENAQMSGPEEGGKRFAV